MNLSLWIGILIPFIGTTLGAAMVFFLKKEFSGNTQKLLTGFAAGVMVAASVWSLLIPSLEESESLGRFSFLPAAIGFLLGMGFLLFLDVITPHMHLDEAEEGPKVAISKSVKLILTVTIHNIPEGLAIGIVFANYVSANATISFMSALALSIGIAIQNFPEGAIVSMPLTASGLPKWKTFLYGTLSGAVEPLAALLTIFAARYVIVFLPYLLSFAAGAMLYVVVEELIPEMSEGEHSNIGTIAFSLGFVLMMVLDVALGG